MDSLAIRKATIKDAEEIEKLVSSVHISKINTTENGFLTHNEGIRGYKIAVKKTKYFYVAEMKGRIVGFLIAYSKESLKPANESRTYMLSKWKNDYFIYMYQIAVSPLHHNTGIGKKLYKKFFSDTKNKKKIVFTSKNPHNKASEKFHLKMGFKKVDEVVWKNGESSFVYEMK